MSYVKRRQENNWTSPINNLILPKKKFMSILPEVQCLDFSSSEPANTYFFVGLHKPTWNHVDTNETTDEEKPKIGSRLFWLFCWFSSWVFLSFSSLSNVSQSHLKMFQFSIHIQECRTFKNLIQLEFLEFREQKKTEPSIKNFELNCELRLRLSWITYTKLAVAEYIKPELRLSTKITESWNSSP